MRLVRRIFRYGWPLVVVIMAASCASQPKPLPGATLYVTIANDLGPAQGSIQVTTAAIRATDGHRYWSVAGQWQYHHVLTAPLAVDNAILTVTDDNAARPTARQLPTGYLNALNPADGTTLWRDQIGAFASQPLVSGQTIYVTGLVASSLVSRQKVVYAIRATDGHVLWSSKVSSGSSYNDSLTLANHTLFIASNDLCSVYFCTAAYLLGVNTANGAVVWDDTLQGNFTISPPVVAGGVVFVQAVNSLLAFAAADGTPLWSRDFWQPPFVYQGMAYVGAHLAGDPGDPASQNAVFPLNPQTITTPWSQTSALFPDILAIDQHAIYFDEKAASADNPPYIDQLSALNVTTGAPLWTTQIVDRLTKIIEYHGVLYANAFTFANDQENYVLAFDAATGKQLWQTTLAAPTSAVEYVDTVFAMNQGVLFAAFKGNALFALQASDGRLLWHDTVTGNIAGLTVVTAP